MKPCVAGLILEFWAGCTAWARIRRRLRRRDDVLNDTQAERQGAGTPAEVEARAKQ